VSGALEGIKVIDFTRRGPGPYCTMILGDLGADVIRLEEPGARPPARGRAERRAAAFDALNRNKRSVILNLKNPEGRRILHRLCEDLDVFVEGFRPGVMKRLGCDYDALRAINPRLVYCSISGYGQDGPYEKLPGHDVNYNAVAGALHVLSPEGATPMVPPNMIADLAGGGMQAVIGILGALMARERTGCGQYVDISITDGVFYLLAHLGSVHLEGGAIPKDRPRIHGRFQPSYNVYRCKDGKYISVACGDPRFWVKLCRALGCEAFIPHEMDAPRYPEILEAFGKAFLTRTRDQWCEKLGGIDPIAVSPVHSLEEAFRDPQILHRRMVQEVGELDGEPVRHVGIGPKLSETPGSVRRMGSVPGEHTDEVLHELGYASRDIVALRQEGAIE